MNIEEKFYTMGESELLALCRLFMHVPKDDFLIHFYNRLEFLKKDLRISELKFKVFVNNGQE